MTKVSGLLLGSTFKGLQALKVWAETVAAKAASAATDKRAYIMAMRLCATEQIREGVSTGILLWLAASEETNWNGSGKASERRIGKR